MGVLGKLVPQKTPAMFKSSTYKSLVTPSKKDSPAPSSAEFEQLEAQESQEALRSGGGLNRGFDAYDIPTIFTTFMVFYLGFFGLTLTVYPYAFAADGLPFANPMAYWTTITAEMAFIFRIAGVGFLTLVIGPFLDDILGQPGSPLGVSMMAFTWQMCVINGLIFLVFVYYTMWAPLATAVPLTWMAQTYFGAFVFGWSLIEVTGTARMMYLYSMFNTLYFGGFALALLTIPDVLFGPPSPVKYWENWPTVAVMTARFLGSVMFCVVIGGYYLYFNRSGLGGFTKALTTWNVLVGFTFILPAFFGEGSAVANMWQIQLAFQVPIVVVGIYLELSGVTGGWKLSTLAPSKCGANCETFNLIAFIWLIGFVPVMFTDPNMFMGPTPITGFPMFLEAIDETGKFFGKSWAIAVTILILGPYAYGFKHVSAAKQTTLSFLFFCCIFGAALIFTPTILNPVTMIPLASVNLLLFVFGLYAVLTSGEALLAPMV